MNLRVPLALLLSAVLLPAHGETLALWTADSTPEQVKSWSDRAAGEKWTVVAYGPESPVVKRALTDGDLVRPLLHPKDGVDLALLGKTLKADWILLPSDSSLLLGVKSLQTSKLSLSDKPQEDRVALNDAALTMEGKAETAGQLEVLAARWLSYGQSDMALQTLFEAQALEPNRVITQALMVDAYRKKGNFKEAQRFLRMAMKLHPGEARLLRAAGELELAQDRPREALEYLVKAGADGNATPELHRLIGETLMGLGRYALAEEEFRLSAEQPGVSAQLARLLEKRGQWSEAADYAVRALEESPNDWEMRFLLAKSVSTGGHYAQAVRDRAKALATAADADMSKNPVSFPLLQSALRDQMADTINAIRQLQLKGSDGPLLYTAAQESVIAADRLRSSLKGRPEWQSEQVSGKERVLALTLWSQGAYDLVKALETKDPNELTDPGETIHDALRQLDESRGIRVQVSSTR